MTPRARATYAANEGTILVITLWIVALLAFLALTLLSRMRLGVRHEQWAQVDLEERELLSTGSQLAFARLKADEDDTVDSYAEAWTRAARFDSTTLLDRGGNAPIFRHPFTVSVVSRDEAGKIDVNRATLPVLIEAIRQTGNVAQAAEIATAIVDWRDADNTGAYESDFYARKSPAYAVANGDLKRTEELLFVEGVTPRLFFGEDANHDGLLDPNEDDGDASPPQDDQDGQLQLGLADLFTVYSDGTLNINTASEQVLRIVLSGAHVEFGEVERLVDAITARRRGPDRLDATDDDTPIMPDAEIAQVIPPEVQTQCALAGVEFGVASPAFRFHIHVSMIDSGAQADGELVVVRDSGELEVKEWYDSQP